VTLNSLGTFISSAGAMAALLTLLHVLTEKKLDEINENVAIANFTLTCIARQYQKYDIYICEHFSNYKRG